MASLNDPHRGLFVLRCVIVLHFETIEDDNSFSCNNLDNFFWLVVYNQHFKTKKEFTEQDFVISTLGIFRSSCFMMVGVDKNK